MSVAFLPWRTMEICRVVSAVTVSSLAFPLSVNAQSATCTEAYEKAQEKRADGHLTAALAELRSCVDSACPDFVREDCKRWLNETEAELPTVVFSVVQGGRDVAESEVYCDGDLLTGVLDGKAVPMDPGFHLFTVKIPGADPVERKLLIRAGERNRIVEFVIHPSVEAPAVLPPVPPPMPPPALGQALEVPPARATDRSRVYWTYGLSGMGVLGLAGFTLFGALGASEKSDLEQSCAPYCKESQVDSVRTKYLIADTCLGVGLVSLGMATYLYLSNRGQQKGAAASLEIVPRAMAGGGVVQVSRPF